MPLAPSMGPGIFWVVRVPVSRLPEAERVLEEPHPLVTFESFGDNALTMMLRCFVGSMEYRIQTASELNQEINRKFEDAGIVIAFPQRDIHLDTAQPLDVRIHRVATPRSAATFVSRTPASTSPRAGTAS